jgi:hypothetical protein
MVTNGVREKGGGVMTETRRVHMSLEEQEVVAE